MVEAGQYIYWLTRLNSDSMLDRISIFNHRLLSYLILLVERTDKKALSDLHFVSILCLRDFKDHFCCSQYNMSNLSNVI